MTQVYDAKTATAVTQTAHQAMITMLRKSIPASVAQAIVGVQPMNGSTGSIFTSPMTRAEWGFEGHNKKYWPYQYNVDAWVKVSPAEQWCWQNFKGRNWRNVGRYFAFKRKEDAALFVLKWS